jgi:hypothetical protein
MENQTAQNEVKSSEFTEEKAYIYVVMPFQIVITSDDDSIKSKGNLFDEVTDHLYSQEELSTNADCLMKKISAWSEPPVNSSPMLGDFSKYYGFMRNHFGSKDEKKDISAFKLETSRIKPGPGFESFKNLQEQFSRGAYLGQSNLRMHGMDELAILVNSTGGIGFFICGFKSTTTTGNTIDAELANAEFFRNIGWRRKEKPKIGKISKHSWVFDGDVTTGLTLYELLQCYFADLSECIRFYQDRPTVLYSLSSKSTGSKTDNELCALAYEIIRVPDRNADRFEHSLIEPTIQRVGRNVAFTALNEGALIIETINKEASIKTVANKYLPAFILALNQREVLLSTMQNIVQLETHELNKQDEEIFNKMERLRNGLLILQLKQIFYTVSNLHEVELFFNQLQRSFAVERMLMENEQCIREMHNLLEVRRNKEIERTEKEKAEKDERRSNIIDTILGAIGCLGLFSFLKDLIPFYNDSETYVAWYRLLSVILPVLVMAYIVRLVLYSK